MTTEPPNSDGLVVRAQMAAVFDGIDMSVFKQAVQAPHRMLVVDMLHSMLFAAVRQAPISVAGAAYVSGVCDVLARLRDALMEGMNNHE